jgi:glycine betaine/proline transport system permease protein
MEFPELFVIPLDKWIDALVDWLTVEGDFLFDAIGGFLLRPMLGVEKFLLWLPWFVFVIVVALVAWRLSSWKLAVGVVIGLVFIGSLGLWEDAMKTLSIVFAATGLAILTGVPIGILIAQSKHLRSVVRPLLDLMQTMPSFVYLIPALMFFGLGKVPALIAVYIYAVPPAIRLTDLGIRQVDANIIEAARAFGATKWQILTNVQLPLAMPTLMTGINQTIMMALSMVVVASMIGAGGLGTAVLNGIARLEVGRGFNGGISIVILAIIIDRLTQNLVHKQNGNGQSEEDVQ